MDLPIVVGFGSLLVVAVLDFVLAMKWNRHYFAFGIPVFIRRVERPQGIAELQLAELEASSATAAGAPLLFHRLSPNRVAFRDKVFGGMVHYVPIMHGVIEHEPSEGVTRVVGVLNWFVLVFIINMTALLGKRVVDILPMMLGVFAIIYFVQAVRYGRVAKKLSPSRDVPQDSGAALR